MRLVEIDGILINPEHVVSVSKNKFDPAMTVIAFTDGFSATVANTIPEVVAKLTAKEPQVLATTVSSGTAFVGPTKAERALKEIVGLVDEHVALSPELRTAPGWVVSKIYKIAREASE